MQDFSFREFFARSSDVLPEDNELSSALARLPPLASGGPWLAGGAVRRTLLRVPIDSDFDFFFASQEQFMAFEEEVKSRGGWLVSRNDHNATFKLPSVAPKPTGENEFSSYLPEITVQAITTRWYGSIAEVLDSFDFTICQFGFDGQALTCGDFSLWDLGRKRLVPHKITYGTASLRRLLKYTKQGFRVCAGGLSEFLNQVINDPSIIRAETQYID